MKNKDSNKAWYNYIHQEQLKNNWDSSTYDSTYDSMYEQLSGTMHWTRIKPQRKLPMPSTSESLAKRPLSKTDRKWMAKIFREESIEKMPRTIFMKLMGKGLIKIALTKEGRPEGFVGAMKEL